MLNGARRRRVIFHPIAKNVRHSYVGTISGTRVKWTCYLCGANQRKKGFKKACSVKEERVRRSRSKGSLTPNRSISAYSRNLVRVRTSFIYYGNNYVYHKTSVYGLLPGNFYLHQFYDVDIIFKDIEVINGRQ